MKKYDFLSKLSINQFNYYSRGPPCKSDISDSQWHLSPIKDEVFWLKTDIFIVGPM